MKKFNPERELRKVKNKKKKSSSKINNMLVPILVMGCSCLALVAVAFSTNLVSETKKEYTVQIEVVNGEHQTIIKTAKEGPFKLKIEDEGQYGNLSCNTGYLDYNKETNEVSANYLNQDTNCILVYNDNNVKNIKLSELNMINDNQGTSYYYKADSTNNYVKINDMLFRIVRINGDGSIRLILNDIVLSSTFGENNIYNDSELEKNLVNWFNSHFANQEYIEQEDYDITNYADIEIDSLINYDGYKISDVGTLSVKELELITDGVKETNYLDNASGFYLANGNGAGEVYCYRNGKIESVLPNATLGVRPVINIKGELKGSGTDKDPYTIQ